MFRHNPRKAAEQLIEQNIKSAPASPGRKRVGSLLFVFSLLGVHLQEATYVEGWPSTTSAWAGWSRFDIPVYRYGGVHSLLICTSSLLGFPTCHWAS
jgi:hypothetical protein